MRQRGAAMEETLRILPQAWSGEPFTHEGAVYQLPTLAVRPTPSTRIPILIGGGAEPALRRAARLADGIFSNAPADGFGKQVEWVLDELEQAGRDPSTFRFIHYAILLPGASRADALGRYRDAVWALNWKYSDMEASATRSLPAASPPPFEGDAEKLLSRRTTHAGTPDELVEALLEVRRQVPVPVEFVARSHLPFLEYDAQIEVMQQLAEGVAPHV
jgi:alkanesulfonate monooxygenase SsuD/methylene tetrahydromethanopterin reductase-like flavin-dependent oxidoreductase (luciferase family)